MKKIISKIVKKNCECRILGQFSDPTLQPAQGDLRLGQPRHLQGVQAEQVPQGHL